MTRLHVRRDIIARDRKVGGQGCAIGVETAGKPKRYAKSVDILGPARLVYRPATPLHCGARAWIETDAKVVLHK